MELYNYKAIIEYDGTDFFGFQSQPENVRTVQNELIAVFNKIFSGEEIKLSYAGRTDTGVHATGQVVNFKSHKYIELSRLKWSLNSLLANDITVRSVEFKSPEFDSRRSALWREYVYYIINDNYQSVFLKKYSVLFCRELDLSIMQKAGELFIGIHDFKAFCSPNDSNKNKIRNILNFEISKTDNFYQKNMIMFKIRANAFLYNMARIMVGMITEIGIGLKKISDIEKGFTNKDINYSGSMIDAKGLFLSKVGY